MESSTFLLIDENGKDTAIFSGDTLFLGDVGRPDLAQKAANLTQEELAGLLYDSIYNKILPLQMILRFIRLMAQVRLVVKICKKKP
jgi:glyoxylase-like metal-dependent hydrolase (beta-lactamase superfamily II)